MGSDGRRHTAWFPPNGKGFRGRPIGYHSATGVSTGAAKKKLLRQHKGLRNSGQNPAKTGKPEHSAGNPSAPPLRLLGQGVRALLLAGGLRPAGTLGSAFYQRTNPTSVGFVLLFLLLYDRPAGCALRVPTGTRYMHRSGLGFSLRPPPWKAPDPVPSGTRFPMHADRCRRTDIVY